VTSPARPYRRRPLQVEAVQLTADADWEAIAQWCGGKHEVLTIEGGPYRIIRFQGPDGMRATVGQGEWLVHSGAIFYKLSEQGFQDHQFEAVPDLELPLCPRCCSRVDIGGTNDHEAVGECRSCGWKFDSAFRWEARR
jgi:hypothetical protein